MLALAPPPPPFAVKVHSAWVSTAATTRVRSLSLTGVPATASVELRCRGGGCRFRSRTVATHGASRVTLTRALRRARLHPGAVLDIRLTDPAAGALIVRFTMNSGRQPTRQRIVVAVPGEPATADPGTGAPAPTDPVPAGPGPPMGQPGPSKGQQALDVATA